MARNLEGLMKELEVEGVLRTPRIIEAFRRVDRARFVPTELQTKAYDNIPLPIGFGQTISQPYTVAVMLEALQPKEGERVLDVGAGSGWVTALLAQLVGLRGFVIGVELLPRLAKKAQGIFEQLDLPYVRIVAGDASRGWPDGSPYDIIHVAAATKVIPPQFTAELTPGGRAIIPVGEPIQDLALLTKTSNNTITEQRIAGFQFVPLIQT